jgi:hypothetical protein
MPEEGFLRRWARVKATGGEAVAEAPRPVVPAAPAAPAAPPAVIEPARQAAPAGEPVPPAPTLEDAARLTPTSDFSAFVSQGVDKDVRRLALKKLFADPHFNVMDRLDMYMDDYNKPDPVSATMLAALQHARGVLRRPEEVQAELARLAARDAPAAAPAQALADEQAEVHADVQAAEVLAAEVQADLAQAGPAQEQGADGIVPGEPAADTLVRSSPAAGISIDAARVPHPLPARPIEAPADTIALPSLCAHNAEASP